MGEPGPPLRHAQPERSFASASVVAPAPPAGLGVPPVSFDAPPVSVLVGAPPSERQTAPTRGAQSALPQDWQAESQ
jgi:hypothetical protein